MVSRDGTKCCKMMSRKIRKATKIYANVKDNVDIQGGPKEHVTPAHYHLCGVRGSSKHDVAHRSALQLRALPAIPTPQLQLVVTPPIQVGSSQFIA